MYHKINNQEPQLPSQYQSYLKCAFNACIDCRPWIMRVHVWNHCKSSSSWRYGGVSTDPWYLTFSIPLILAAVVSSVSEFIGFLVISIFPSQSQKIGRTRQSIYRNKSADCLIVNNEESREDIGSNEDIVSLPSNSRTLPIPTPLPIHHTGSVAPAGNPALANPEFWIIAFIMSMRIFSRVSNSNAFIVSGCGLMYINVWPPLFR